ncbi:Uncharacterised protein [Serratia plymuthica]|nr:Uncharacterised protein [Serratia plymuthica]
MNRKVLDWVFSFLQGNQPITDYLLFFLILGVIKLLFN